MSPEQTRAVNFAKDFGHNSIGHLYARLHVCMILACSFGPTVPSFHIPIQHSISLSLFYFVFLILINYDFKVSVPFLLGGCGGALGPLSAVLDHWIHLMISHCHCTLCLILSCGLLGFICPAQQLSVDIQAFDAVLY